MRAALTDRRPTRACLSASFRPAAGRLAARAAVLAAALVASGALWTPSPALAEQGERTRSDREAADLRTPPLPQLFPDDPTQGGARGTISGWRPADGVPPDAQALRKSERPADLARTGAPGAVSVLRLGTGNPDAAGLISARAAGLPRDLWSGAEADQLAPRLTLDPRVPALRGLMRRVLLAQLDPPARASLPEGGMLAARADALVADGEPGAALMLLLVAGTPDLNRSRRIFDAALLTGQDGALCRGLVEQPGAAPDLPARIWCLAQQGDWAAASLALQGGRDTGLIAPAMATLLAAFLDDSTAEQLTDGAPDVPLSPLVFRLREATGAPMPTQGLPLAYAVTDLGPNGGWLARLQSAERLARAGALPAADLAQVYGEHAPAASGAAWDRARSWQTIAAALEGGDGAALAAGLPLALDRFAAGGLAPTLAELVAPRLPEAPPPGDAATTIVVLRLLAGLPVTAPDSVDPILGWLAALARDPADAGAPPADPQGQLAPLAAALAAPSTPATPSPKAMALLDALADADAGFDGDLARAARGLGALSSLGFATQARQAAVEMLVLARLGRVAGAP